VKKILGISIAIVLIIGAVAGGTWAYFSDTETSGTNTFSAGTIDIAIDGENPWSGSFAIEDMKPCEVGYITFDIENVGTNPVVVWKTVTVLGCGPGPQYYTAPGGGTASSEPEFLVDPGDNNNYIADDIWYDLSVLVNAGSPSTMGDPAGSGWWQLIYDEDVTITTISGQSILLGMIPVGGTMEVTQSYHMDAGVENEHQGDTMDFTILIYGEQQTGNLTLENKTGDPDWMIKAGDGIGASLTYNTMGPTFDYTLTASGLADGNYSLIYYADPWPGTGGFLIDTMTCTAGVINQTNSVELGSDMPAAGDGNFPYGAKLWLIPSSAYSGGQVTAWTPNDNWLFETLLITYNDTDV
jgi:spore coat-associated protein N